MANLGNVGFSIGGMLAGYDPHVSGTGTISGTLQQNGSNCNAKLWLYNEQFGWIIDYIIANGSFSFGGLNTALRYTVRAEDIDSTNYNQMIYRNITPS